MSVYLKRFCNAPHGVGGRVGARNSRIWKLSCVLVHRSELVVYPGLFVKSSAPCVCVFDAFGNLFLK